MTKYKLYNVTMKSPLSGVTVHKFNAANKALAERAALIKYPYKTIEKVEEVK